MTKKTRKKGINAKEKGDRAERAVAKMFSKWWGSEFARTPGSGGFATKTFRDDWNAAGDLVTPDESFPFTVEVKHNEGWEMHHLLTAGPTTLLWQFWEQCVSETIEGNLSLLVFTKNHLPWFYMIRSSDSRPLGGQYLTMFTPEGLSDKAGGIVQVGLLSDLFETNPYVWVLFHEKVKFE